MKVPRDKFTLASCLLYQQQPLPIWKFAEVVFCTQLSLIFCRWRQPPTAHETTQPSSDTSQRKNIRTYVGRFRFGFISNFSNWCLQTMLQVQYKTV